jgi:hypothetical protein
MAADASALLEAALDRCSEVDAAVQARDGRFLSRFAEGLERARGKAATLMRSVDEGHVAEEIGQHLSGCAPTGRNGRRCTRGTEA